MDFNQDVMLRLQSKLFMLSLQICILDPIESIKFINPIIYRNLMYASQHADLIDGLIQIIH